MLDFIRKWIVNIVALAMFIVMAEMLIPGGRMRKYAGLVTGAILIIAIITPLLDLAGGGFDFVAAQAASSAELDWMQLKEESKVLEGEQMDQIIEVYRKNMIEQIEQNACEVEGVKSARADIIINEDWNSAAFGEIKRAYIEIEVNSSNKEDENAASDGSEKIRKPFLIDKVENIRVGNGEKDEPVVDDCPSELRKCLEDRIGQVFGIDRKNIIITRM